MTDKVMEGSHAMRQKAAYSNAPVFERSCVDFACGPVLCSCQAAYMADRVRANDFDGEQVNVNVGLLVSALEATQNVLNQEHAMPYLMWLFGEAASKGEFLEYVAEVESILSPVYQKAQGEHSAKLAASQEKMAASLIDGSQDMSDDVFFGKLTTAKVEKLRACRGNLQAAIKSYKLCFPDKVEEVQTAEASEKGAFLLTVRYGFLAFLNSPAISLDNKAGQGARDNLGAVWALHKDDDGVMEYLGKNYRASPIPPTPSLSSDSLQALTWASSGPRG